jgi:hypothetical protein
LAAQTEHEHAASQNRASFASENHGRPAIAATARPGEFSGREATRASGGERGGNDRAVARPENHEGRNSDARNNEAGRASSRENAKPSKQEKQTQKKAQKQAKAEQKRKDRE